ncbi:class F sortase [Nocardioides pacificus]
MSAAVILGGSAALTAAQDRDPAAGRADDSAATQVTTATLVDPPPPASSQASSPARPRHLRIPEIGVSTRLLSLGLNADDSVEVPSDEQALLAGWYDQGTIPGQPGSAVILGHVDSTSGPAVFHRLADLRTGSAVEVALADGSMARFRVTHVETYANADFPAQSVYAGSPGRTTLNLVTCGGVYDAQRGGWQSNVVAYTELDTTRP